MTFTLTIGGAAQQLRDGSLSIRKIANGRHTASFQLDSLNRSYRAPIDAEVIMAVDGTRILGGIIDRPAESGLLGGQHPGITTQINVVDFNVYTEWRFVNVAFPAQTLKARLQTLITSYLGDYGITLHASQVDGPTLAAVTYSYVRLDTVLNEQMTLTADSGQPFVWRIDYFKVLRAYQPSSQPAPFNLVGDSLPKVDGDIEVMPSNDGRANRVIVKVTPTSETNRVETFTGDGVTSSFVPQYTVTQHYGYVTTDAAIPLYETLTTPGMGTATWLFDPSINTYTRLAGPPAAGAQIEFRFNGTFDGGWTATDPSWTSTPASRKEKVITLDSIPTGTTGQAFADSELAKCLTGPVTVKYRTWEAGIEPGMSQTVNVPARNVNEVGVVTEVIIRDRVQRLERLVTVIVDDAQTNLDRTWGDVYRLWAGDKAGAPSMAAVGSVSSVGPGVPFKSVQFNNSGSFGGDASFTYDEDTNSLVCGLDSSITAAAPESCQAFGNNCHIADA